MTNTFDRVARFSLLLGSALLLLALVLVLTVGPGLGLFGLTVAAVVLVLWGGGHLAAVRFLP